MKQKNLNTVNTSSRQIQKCKLESDYFFLIL